MNNVSQHLAHIATVAQELHNANIQAQLTNPTLTIPLKTNKLTIRINPDNGEIHLIYETDQTGGHIATYDPNDPNCYAQLISEIQRYQAL